MSTVPPPTPPAAAPGTPPATPEGPLVGVLKGLAGLDKLPWATIFAGIVLVLVAVVGGVIVIFGDDALSFDTYVKALSDLAIGLGLVAVGRGITKAGAHVGKDPQSR